MLTIKKKPTPAVPLVAEDTRKLGDAIEQIEVAIKALNKAGLNHHAIVVLLADSTKLSKKVINKVLDGLAKLSEDYGA